MKKYLFLVSVSYSYPILRPLQKVILERGDQVAWFIDNPEARKFLREGERELTTVEEVLEYDPIAVFAPGTYAYDFFPGINVQLFHGFYIDKRRGRYDRHFWIRGWFDLYCTTDTTASQKFEKLAEEYGSFRAAFTGWSKLDNFFRDGKMVPLPDNTRPVILYSSTFTDWITSTPFLFDEIERLVKERDWEWIITFHPLMDPDMTARYKALAKHKNVTFYDGDNNIEILEKADVMLCDSSSIIFEFLYLDKPVVTFCNTNPGDYLIDIDDPALLEVSIETALLRPPDLMERIRAKMDSMHPQRDGRSSERVLAAVDDFNENYKGKLKKKRLSLDRQFRARKRLHYFPVWEKFKGMFRRRS